MTRLNSLIFEAVNADPSDRLICPIDERRYSTLFGCVRSDVAVLRIAAQIETSPDALLYWYTKVKILELGDMTAQGLVDMGRSEAVIQFLREIRDGHRG